MSLLKLTTTTVLLLSLSCLSAAFQPQIAPIRHASSPSSSLSRHVENPMIPPPPSVFFRNALSLQSQTNNKDSKQASGYTQVEDGSPLGVAIVVLGGSLVVFGGDNFENVPVWVVFVVASTAAGVARLIRYLQDK